MDPASRVLRDPAPMHDTPNPAPPDRDLIYDVDESGRLVRRPAGARTSSSSSPLRSPTFDYEELADVSQVLLRASGGSDA